MVRRRISDSCCERRHLTIPANLLYPVVILVETLREGGEGRRDQKRKSETTCHHQHAAAVGLAESRPASRYMPQSAAEKAEETRIEPLCSLGQVLYMTVWTAAKGWPPRPLVGKA